MADDEINEIRTLLTSRPRPVGWAERRARIEEVGAAWPRRGGYCAHARPDRRIFPPNGHRRRASIPPASSCFFTAAAIVRGRSSATGAWSPRQGAPPARGRSPSPIGSRPEHPFPAAYDDALAAWRFLRAEGIAAEHIAVGGDSAGGGLSLGLAMRLRDAGEAGPGCLWLCSPWTDLTMSGETIATKDAVDP